MAMGGGFVKVDRRMVEDFGRKPYCEGWAWLWMVAAAAWQDEGALERGQLSFSQRAMAQKFGWTRDKVRWFLTALEVDQRVKIHTPGHTPGHTPPPAVITICDYDRYSGGRTARTPRRAPITPHKKKKEEKKEKKDNSKSIDYAFEGKFVRLNQRDFSVWQRGYSSVDLVALLTTRDIWLASDRATDADRKNWFVSTSNWLANKNQEARKAALPHQGDPATLWQQALL